MQFEERCHPENHLASAICMWLMCTLPSRCVLLFNEQCSSGDPDSRRREINLIPGQDWISEKTFWTPKFGDLLGSLGSPFRIWFTDRNKGTNKFGRETVCRKKFGQFRYEFHDFKFWNFEIQSTNFGWRWNFIRINSDGQQNSPLFVILRFPGRLMACSIWNKNMFQMWIGRRSSAA